MLKKFAIALPVAAMLVACANTDAGVTTAVKSKLASSDTVKASDINVDTHDHIVTLTGTVESEAAKREAVTIARNTDGVTDVIDQLAIGNAPASTTGELENRSESYGREAAGTTEAYGREAAAKTEAFGHEAAEKTGDAAQKTREAAGTAGEVIGDAAITSEVKTKFLAEPGVPGSAIHVETNDGVVTLSGTVRTQAEADKAMSIARDSKGVKRVVNHMKVSA
jgi:hyperosmotically inducible protein